MQPLNIHLVTLGQQKEPIDIQFLQAWKSKVFSVRHVQHIEIAPDTDGPNWSYTDRALRSTIRPTPSADVTVAIVSSPLEGNYYSRRLGEGVCALSLHEMAGITRRAHFKVENFLIRSIYGYAIYHHVFGHVPASAEASWSHHATRRCVFDMNGLKEDIVYSLHQPRLCEECLMRLRAAQIPPDFAQSVQRELLLLKKGALYRFLDWANAYPGRALAWGVVASVVINVCSNYIYDHASKLRNVLDEAVNSVTNNSSNERTRP
jgi:hypothetical protein